MRVLPLLAAFVLGAGSAFLVACGGGDNLIPSSDASSIENALSQVSSDFHSGRCSAAQDAVTKLHSALVNLPDSVDSRLRSRLRQGVNHLDTRVRQTCTAQTQTQQQTQTQPTNTNTGTTDTGTTDTGTTDTGTTDTGTTGTTDTGTTGTGTTGTQTTTGTTTGTDTTGGTPPGDG